MSSRALLAASLLAASLYACGGEVQGDPDTDYSAGSTTNDTTGGDDTPSGPTPTTPGTPSNPEDPGEEEPTDPPVSTFPSNPMTYSVGQSIKLNSGTSDYWILVPRAYDASHNTPSKLYIYLHGCGGESSGDVWAAGNIDGDWIGLAPGGAEGACWDNQARGAEIVMAAIAHLKTRFNIDPKRILIGGYSSGGDLSYYTAFKYADKFAAVLSHNSIPAYRTQDLTTRINGAARKFPVYHLSATEDGTYNIVTVRDEMRMLRDAGFTVTFIERAGAHYDDNTTPYRNSLLFPHLWDDLALP